MKVYIPVVAVHYEGYYFPDESNIPAFKTRKGAQNAANRQTKEIGWRGADGAVLTVVLPS